VIGLGVLIARYTPAVLYFAYGSNLDEENWAAWCQREGYDAASIEPIGPAWLPDYELVFHYQSRLREGGALDLRPRPGMAIPGALFRVSDWQGLDAKEGVSGGYYRRLAVTALTDDGQAHSATTYTVCDARIGNFVPPGVEYRAMVLRGLSRFGHASDGFLAAADGVQAVAMPSALFAYGTLMRGQRSHALLEPRVRRAHGPARIEGASLLQIDWYPGLVLSPVGAVHGEVYELEEVDTVIGELDAYEDFAGYDRGDSLYRRSLVRALTKRGPMLAWTYVFLGDPSAFMPISSGRWADA
jgi:gamma-glutamylcyclotransferase (GGCT)/AIG2-like uncharacterized protein YtfP